MAVLNLLCLPGNVWLINHNFQNPPFVIHHLRHFKSTIWCETKQKPTSRHSPLLWKISRNQSTRNEKKSRILTATGNDYVLPSVIIDFIYFDDKNNVYKSRKLLTKTSNEINDQNLYINDHLPEVDAKLKKKLTNKVS